MCEHHCLHTALVFTKLCIFVAMVHSQNCKIEESIKSTAYDPSEDQRLALITQRHNVFVFLRGAEAAAWRHQLGGQNLLSGFYVHTFAPSFSTYLIHKELRSLWTPVILKQTLLVLWKNEFIFLNKWILCSPDSTVQSVIWPDGTINFYFGIKHCSQIFVWVYNFLMFP